MDTKRRDVVRLLATGIILAAPLPVLAQPPRILREPYTPPERPPQRGGASADLERFFAELRVGDTATHGRLTVLWLHGRPVTPLLAVLTLEEARAAGDVIITERDRATVPSLIVENRGKRHVLLLAGEILLGGKQDRVLREDVLLPPASGPRDISVYCVEQGRWFGASTRFESGAALAAPGLRGRVMEHADQQRVWKEVDLYARAAKAPPSAGYQGVQESADVKRETKEAERAFDVRAAAGACGAAVFVGARPVAIDAFEDARLFGRLWAKLVRAFAVEALREPREKAFDPIALRARTGELVAKAARAPGAERQNAGAGTIVEFRVEETLRGAGLVAERQVVHVAVL